MWSLVTGFQEGKKKEKEEQVTWYKHETNIKITNLSTNNFMITLNVNVLDLPIKRQRF